MPEREAVFCVLLVCTGNVCRSALAERWGVPTWLVEEFGDEADLTLTMTRAHRQQVLSLAPRSLARTFTLREAADLVALVGSDFEPNGTAPADRARGLVQAMADARPARVATIDDIADPIGRPQQAHAEAGDLIAASLLPVLGGLASVVSHAGSLPADRLRPAEAIAGSRSGPAIRREG